jgi:O-antigen/teichoic acid export membrane protein
VSAAGSETAGGLGASIVSGTRWTAASQVGTQAIRLGSAVMLARLLAPEHFGIMAMVFVVTTFLELFKDLGTASALVQRPELGRTLASSLFFLNLGFGIALSVIAFAGSPLIAAAYGDPQVEPVLRLMSLAVLVSSTSVVHQAMLRRRLRFGRLGVTLLVNALVTAVVSILLAALSFGVWALAWGLIAGTVVGAVAAWSLSEWRPVMTFHWRDVRGVLAFSMNLSAAQLATFLLFNLDKVLIGRFLGATTLGFYAIAQRILMQPVRTATQALHEVLFAALSRVQDDRDALTDAYLRTGAGVALVVFPAVTGMAVLASPLVETLLGDQWAPAGPVLTVLAPGIAVQALITTTVTLYKVRDRTDLMLRWTLASGVVVALAWYGGLQWGLIGVAWGFSGAILVLAYPAFAIPFRLIGLSVRRFARTLAPCLAATGLMAAGSGATSALLQDQGVDGVWVLVSAVPAGAFVYVGAIWWLKAPGVHDLTRLVGRSRVNAS